MLPDLRGTRNGHRFPEIQAVCLRPNAQRITKRLTAEAYGTLLAVLREDAFGLPIRGDNIRTGLAWINCGSTITCQPSFEIRGVDFIHTDNEFQAVLFFCRFSGTKDGVEFSFRKCCARGCPYNLCPHVSQAVMIANRYLQEDYRGLDEVGVHVTPRLFSLDDMVVKFRDFKEEQGLTLSP